MLEDSDDGGTADGSIDMQKAGIGEGLRVVRVGTHALISSSQTTLWQQRRPV